MICGEKTTYYFSKSYTANKYWDELDVDYNRCHNCGFTFSVTHQALSETEWGNLNARAHYGDEDDIKSKNIDINSLIANKPPYGPMAFTLNLLAKNSIIDTYNSIDYASGYGTLAKLLRKYFDTNIQCYDPFVRDPEPLVKYISTEELSKYGLVINSAMFEHVRKREDLDKINDLVSHNGVLMLHTVICENIPKDPDWFYLTPIVHTAFHTNKSMSFLMEQWGYSDSMYSPAAKSWFLFKDRNEAITKLPRMIENINVELQTEFLFHKTGFVDYWKGF